MTRFCSKLSIKDSNGNPVKLGINIHEVLKRLLYPQDYNLDGQFTLSEHPIARIYSEHKLVRAFAKPHIDIWQYYACVRPICPE